MDLSKYSLEEIILSAIKSEVEASEVYTKLADNVKNAFLKEKLIFLAKEEKKHKLFIDILYKQQFPNKNIKLPEKTPVPLPEIKIYESINLSEVIEDSMEAEKAAQEFYIEFSKFFKKNPQIQMTLQYFSKMEEGHYKLLELERDSIMKFESYDDFWPMMHAGP